MGAKDRKLTGQRKVKPVVMVPLTEMMDHSIPEFVQHPPESFSQFVIRPSAEISPEPTIGSLPEVMIHNFEKNYMVCIVDCFKTELLSRY